jgi:hypothetical protein
MKVKVQVIIEDESDSPLIVQEVACLCRGDLLPETLGLTLAEGKHVLAQIQEKIVAHQAAEYVEQQRLCPACGRTLGNKDTHEIIYRTLFGNLHIDSPRLYTCSCQLQEKRSFSPLAELLPERTAPELHYLQVKWAALMSYGLTVDLLEEVLPLQVPITTVVRHTHQVGERLEGELGEEQVMFVEGCPRDWEALPEPNGRLVVGIDGGYVHAREGDNRKAGWFEVIAGKCVPVEGPAKCFGLVNGYDEKPKRRVFELLRGQGLQMNQDITFLSDGGDTVRDLQLYLSPQSEHVLDWFHITMRLTVMQQMAKGLPSKAPLQDLEGDLERLKWYLWHGNVFRALQVIEAIQMDLETYEEEKAEPDKFTKLLKAVREFRSYIETNGGFIPNYGERYRYGETISSAFVESTINWVVSKRMVKQQQMRWTKRGAHLLLQVRTQTLNGDLRDTFGRWYPAMPRPETPAQLAA